MRIIIAGGGIAGLTSALLAKMSGYTPIVCERSPHLDLPSFGGGIGLWPPSQAVMKNLGLLSRIQQKSLPMPSAAYYDKLGQQLGRPSPTFGSRFPVICLQRKELCEILLEACKKEQILIKPGTSILDYIENQKNVIARLSNGEQLEGELLVGADGINSHIRSKILKEHHMQPIQPHHCGYAYFRAVADVSTIEESSKWHQYSFQSWGDKKRFGYVPLKQPRVFWFVAIPIGEEGLQEYQGSHTCSIQQKYWIIKQFQSWKGPVKIKQLLSMTPADTILRTDIRKIQGVTKFPWVSKSKRVVLVGDSANATAPNLAQGAGLAIQSAWDLFSLVDVAKLEGFDTYVEKRKKRAYTVQTMADMVAKIGQLEEPYSKIRDNSMSIATKLFPKIEQNVFERSVQHSLGGTSSSLYWEPSRNKFSQNNSNISFLQKIVGKNQFHKLPAKTKEFRRQLIGDGQGDVTVEVSPLGKLINLPNNMRNQHFTASVESVKDSDGNVKQKQTRVFGQGTNFANKFSTFHHQSVDLNSKTGYALTETLGFGPDIFRFGYNPVVKSSSQISYKSNGIWVRNFHLPIPAFLCPSSSWIETQTDLGWRFSGQINYPKILGGSKIMKYYGDFKCNNFEPLSKNKTVVISGGSGMIGSEVCKAFYKNGWKVIILTRNKKKTQHKMPYCQIHEWNAEQDGHKLLEIVKQADAIVNLAGQNPGGGLWTGAKKEKIVTSRMKAISAFAKALKMCEKGEDKIFIQASAAGIYGNRGQQKLGDDAESGMEDNFRVSSCKLLQAETRRLIPTATITRFGHVFSSQAGLFPFIKLGSFFGVAKLGEKKCYVPWVHVEDVASAILYTVNSTSNVFRSRNINIAAPQDATYGEVFEQLGKLRGRKGGLFTIPEFLLKNLMGEISSVILQSQRMTPNLLQQQGFVFKFGDLAHAVRSQQCL